MPPHQIADLGPDALLLDMIVPCDRDISRRFREVMPEVKIVALGVAETEQVVMACADAAVSGFVATNGTVEDVVASVHAAVRGELVCSPRMAGMLLSRVRALAARPPSAVQDNMLTQRENQSSRETRATGSAIDPLRDGRRPHQPFRPLTRHVAPMAVSIHAPCSVR